MKRFLTTAFSVVSLASALAVPASAQITPNPTTVVIDGEVTLEQSLQLTCDFTLTAEVDAGGLTGRVTSFVLSEGELGCGSIVVPDSFPWPITYNSAGSLTITGVSSSTFLGRCNNGTISVSWPNPSPSGFVSFTSNGRTIPGWQIGWPLNQGCIVDGSGVVVSSTGGLPVEVR